MRRADVAGELLRARRGELHLDISVKTIDTHRSHVLKKLGLRNNSELTRFVVWHRYAPL